MPKFLVLLLGLLLTARCWAAPPPGSNPAATAKLIVDIYQAAGPRIGCTFVEPSIVLVLGGVKASNGGWANISPPEKADLAVLKRISTEILEPRGIQIVANFDNREKRLNFEVRSLAGLERVLANTHLLSQKIDPPQSFTEWSECQRKVGDALKKRLGGHRGGWRDLYNGVPDRCILDTVKSANKATLVATGPSLRNYYDAPQPVFYVSQAFVNDPEVVKTGQAWDDFLKAVYDSPDYNKVANSAEFKAARIEHIEHWDGWMDKYRAAGKVRRVSRERDRWGISVK